ncbi:MAG TPA: ATP-binding protein [Longimicrobiales bacterium]|nr:ATP-binding protein [Longimicrobiales bacterium]
MSRAEKEPEPGWTGKRPFIGRENVLAALHGELTAASTGAGRFILLHGPDGSGRAALVRRFNREARRRNRRLSSAIGDAADPVTPAWRQIALRLTAGRRVGAAVKRTLSEWIDPLVPVVGPIVSAVVKTVEILRPDRQPRQRTEVMGTGSTIDQVRTLLVHGGEKPRLIILENLEVSDPSELAGASALIQRLESSHTLFIGTAISRSGTLPPAVADLLREAQRLKVGHVIEIPALTPAETARAVEKATGNALPDGWRGWLRDAAPATPAQLWNLLGELQQTGELVRKRGRWHWARIAPVSDGAAVIPFAASELDNLADVDITLLEAAGRLGVAFEAPALAAALRMDEMALEDHLARLVRKQRLRLTDTVERDGDLVDRYEFVRPENAARWAARVERPIVKDEVQQSSGAAERL